MSATVNAAERGHASRALDPTPTPPRPSLGTVARIREPSASITRTRQSAPVYWMSATSPSTDTSSAAVGAPDAIVTVRPEKIHLEAPGSPVPDGSVHLDGTIHDVVYLGSDTKYHVTLDAGGTLAVIKQNVATSSMEALALKGTAVRLVWDRRHTLPVAGAAGDEGSPA